MYACRPNMLHVPVPIRSPKRPRLHPTPTPQRAFAGTHDMNPRTLSSTILLCALETPALFESTWDAIIV